MLDSLFSVGWYFVFVRLESVCVLGSGGLKGVGVLCLVLSVCVLGSGGFEGGGGLVSCVDTEIEYHCKK